MFQGTSKYGNPGVTPSIEKFGWIPFHFSLSPPLAAAWDWYHDDEQFPDIRLLFPDIPISGIFVRSFSISINFNGTGDFFGYGLGWTWQTGADSIFVDTNLNNIGSFSDTTHPRILIPRLHPDNGTILTNVAINRNTDGSGQASQTFEVEGFYR